MRVARLIYRFLYWMGNECGPRAGSNIVYGFHRKFRKPEDVEDHELAHEIKRLRAAIMEAT